MKNNYKNYIQLPGIYIFLLKQVWRQRRFNNKYLQPKLDLYRSKNDGSLTEKDLKKITDYYALGVSGILGTSFCILRGYKIKLAERKAISYLGGISGLLDDLFDNTSKETRGLKDFILTPQEMKPDNDQEGLLLSLYTQGLKESCQPEKIQEEALDVFKAQQESLKQKDKSITNSELEKITLDKGGSSFLYYRACLENSADQNEKKLIYHLGGLMQLGNDIFDVYKDHQEKIHTLATRTIDIDVLRSYFTSELKRSFELAKACDYPSKNMEKFLKIISLGIARVYVCLDQFKVLQLKTDGEFSLEKYSRKELICDMQKPRNQLKAIQYYFEILENS
ncbi:hypothetical protein [Gillisia sp. Hel_I_29]|uniref:hypothetical protein n=1 Tax=Gillisia sp. Hel_I_29 TaxID=1249975 RepID=UPI0005591899|nr:hypothetical protein [Gillisia sp. Hel_I_29]